MKLTMLAFGVFTMVGFASMAAQAQGVPGGVAHGVDEGNRRAGPVGAVVGGVVGGVIGGVEGVLGVDHQPATEVRYVPTEHSHRHHRFHHHYPMHHRGHHHHRLHRY